jgi:hypothetical protein
LSTIENRYNTTTRRLDDEDKIAVVLSAAPDEYQAMLTNEQRRLGANITTEDLEEAMNQYWRQVTAKEGGPNESEDTELTLSAFSGKCYNCGEEGHKSNECKKPKKNGTKSNRKGGKKNLKCYNCGGPNHISKDCWEKEENKDKRPRGWKSKMNATGEQGGAVVDNGNVCELLLCSLTFPMKQQMLTNKNIWIGDMGATVHMMAWRDEFTNIKKMSRKEAVIIWQAMETL